MKPTPDQAETEMRAALDSGDPDRIAAATAVVDELDVAKEPPTLLGAALWYAEQEFHVFPLFPGTKIPFKASRGFHDATTNTDQINTWWSAVPEANVGLATGWMFDAVDIDGPEGQQTRVRMWEDRFAQIDADSVAKVLTPRPGGMHIWVPATGAGNFTKLIPGIDYRGVGGYVVAPPSVIVPGGEDAPGTYRFLGTPSLTGLGAKAGV